MTGKSTDLITLVENHPYNNFNTPNREYSLSYYTQQMIIVYFIEGLEDIQSQYLTDAKTPLGFDEANILLTYLITY